MTIEVAAKHKGARISAQKARLVANQIRGKAIEEALRILSYSPKKAAFLIKRVLESAIANAENNHSLDIDKLVVKEAYVGKGLVMKRFHARARGRGARIIKPFSHLTIILSEQEGS